MAREFTIGELGERSGVSTSALRFYERKGRRRADSHAARLRGTCEANCISCSCLSLKTCGLLNPDDEAAALWPLALPLPPGLEGKHAVGHELDDYGDRDPDRDEGGEHPQQEGQARLGRPSHSISPSSRRNHAFLVGRPRSSYSITPAPPARIIVGFPSASR